MNFLLQIHNLFGVFMIYNLFSIFSFSYFTEIIIWTIYSLSHSLPAASPRPTKKL